jgi:hypothetical protein
MAILLFCAPALHTVSASTTAVSVCSVHDFVWKNGNVPIALQRWEYLGLVDEVPIFRGR